jgi:hypothetical protein
MHKPVRLGLDDQAYYEAQALVLVAGIKANVINASLLKSRLQEALEQSKADVVMLTKALKELE